MSWIFHMGQFNALSQRICQWKKCAQKWCRKCWVTSKKNCVFWFPKKYWTVWKKTNIFSIISSPEMKPRSSFKDLWPGNKTCVSEEWHTTQLLRKKARLSKSMLNAFFDRRGVVHKEFVPPGQTVNARFYVEELTWMQNWIIHVWPDLLGKWKLHHDNALCHGV